MNKDSKYSALKVKDKIKIKGKIQYYMDFSNLDGDFGDRIFSIDEICDLGYWLKSYGYGVIKSPKSYGCGKILVFKKYLSQIIKIT